MTGATGRSLTYFLLGFFCLLLALAALGEKYFWASHVESRRAEIGRTMARTGDYLIPKLNGEKIFTKPPLFYWMAAASYKLTGRETEGAARLPSALLGLGTLLLLFLIARRLYDQKAALAATAVLATSYLFVHYQRLAEPEIPFTFFITLSVYFLLRLDQEPDREARWSILFWLAATFGFMVKGPYALLFPLGGYLVFVAWRGEGVRRKLKTLFVSPGPILFVLFAAPWFLYVTLYDDALKIFHEEAIERIGSSRGKDHPIWFYLTSLVNFSPWILVLPVALAAAVKDAGSRFALSWAGAGLVIATLVSAKNHHYILPLYPAFALITGRYIALVTSMSEEEALSFRRTGLAMVGVIALLPVVATVGLFFAPSFAEEAPHLAVSLIAPFAFLTSLLFLAVLVALLAGKRAMALAATCSSLFVVFLFGHTVVVPSLNQSYSHKPFIQKARSVVGPERPVFMYRLENFQVSFYLERAAPVINDPAALKTRVREAAATGPVYLIVREKHRAEAEEASGGHVILNDETFRPPKAKDGGKKFTLLEIKKRS